jgi:DNA-directed RNA polymerase subunit RPC12/RpoP
MSIIGIILLSIGVVAVVFILSVFIYTYWKMNYGKCENQEKEYICPICGKIMGQEENESEDYIEVWVFCRNCGFRTSSRYYYDQYCEDNNEKKKSLIIQNIKNYLNKK